VIGLAPGQCADDGGPCRLLVVEDREANRRLLITLLTDLGTPILHPVAPGPSDRGPRSGTGFEVCGAVNGQEAIEIWERWKPHLIWMDMRMPVMDGHEATRRIKATPQGQSTVIVALTASAFEEDRALILSEGCDDYIRKPFREQEILDVLTKHLGVRFVYEGAARDQVVTKDVLSKKAMSALPVAWVADLRQAAIQADADLVLSLLDRIREQNPSLADALVSLVRDFRFDTIAALAAPTQDGDKNKREG
jgi:CheY-like chemotaxis protein